MDVVIKMEVFMTYWEWDDSFAIGIEEIDEQHKKIIKFINELQIAFSYNKMYMIEEVIDKLIAYVHSHFRYEEELMEEAGYPLTEAHKLSHSAFVDRIISFKARYEDGENVAKSLRNELQLWMLNHIKYDDNDYAKSILT